MRYVKSKAFISSFVLIFFITITTISSSYAICMRNYLETIDNLERLEKEIIDRAKVIYAFKQIDKDQTREYVVDGIFVSITKEENVYNLIYENQQISLKIIDNQIIDAQ